ARPQWTTLVQDLRAPSAIRHPVPRDHEPVNPSTARPKDANRELRTGLHLSRLSNIRSIASLRVVVRAPLPADDERESTHVSGCGDGGKFGREPKRRSAPSRCVSEGGASDA